jgi:hypothetical protein
MRRFQLLSTALMDAAGELGWLLRSLKMPHRKGVAQRRRTHSVPGAFLRQPRSQNQQWQ